MKKGKGPRRCYLMVFTSNVSCVNCFFVIGAYSVSQARFLGYRSVQKIGFMYDDRETDLTCYRLPVGAPKKGVFVMHEGRVITF